MFDCSPTQVTKPIQIEMDKIKEEENEQQISPERSKHIPRSSCKLMPNQHNDEDDHSFTDSSEVDDILLN